MSDPNKLDCPEYDALLDGVTAAKEQVKKAGATAVAALFKVFFAEYPEVKAVGWKQFTPHFNDGEPCEFSCDSYSLKINGEGEDDYGDINTIDPTLGWGNNERPNPDALHLPADPDAPVRLGRLPRPGAPPGVRPDRDRGGGRLTPAGGRR